MENLLDKEGAFFTADIQGFFCKGVVHIECGEVYLCQDHVDGKCCLDKQGYKYSWVVEDGSNFKLKANDVANFTLLESEEKISIYDERNHGKYFVAEIKGTLVQGRISIEKGRCFLCQNEFSGARVSDKFGFQYSWIINPDHENPFVEANVFNLHVYDNPEECALYLKEAREKKSKSEENFKTVNLRDKWFTANINGLLVYGQICVCDKKIIQLYQDYKGFYAKESSGSKFKCCLEVDLTKGSGSPLEYEGISDFQIFASNCVQAYERMKSMPEYYIHTNSKTSSLTYMNPQCLLDSINDGKYYVAKIHNTPTWGRASINSRGSWLCQNFRDGAVIPDRFGFKYSWMVNSSCDDSSKVVNISNLLIFDDLTGVKEAFENIGGENFEDYVPKTSYIDVSAEKTKTSIEVDIKSCKVEIVSLKDMARCAIDSKTDKLSNISKNSKTKKLFNI